MNALFPDDFLAAIAGLSLVVRPAPPRTTHGTNLSPRPGASLEFRDYQPYAPGDDLRRVDWAVYGRTQHLFVRRFERPTAVPVFVLVDASRSMRLESPARYQTAARLAAAVASAAVAGHNPLRVVIADGREGPVPRAVTGRRGLVRVLSDLAAADSSAGGPGPAAAVRAVLPALAAQGRGVFVVVSDFFEPAGVETLTDALRLADQRLVLLRVTRPADAEPALDDDTEFEDCETGDRRTVVAGPLTLERYRMAYRAYFDALDRFAVARGGVSTSVSATDDTAGQLDRLFPSGVLSL